MRRLILLSFIGVCGGVFSGLFGVGGGIVLVTLLIVALDFTQHRAAGTSLLAMIPISVAGTWAYAANDTIDWLVASCVAVGSVTGAFVGARLLRRIKHDALRWMFIALMLASAGQMAFGLPDRGAELIMSLATASGLFALGLAVGGIAALLGVGGGVIIVPVLILMFGMGDLHAKGTSIVVMFPTALAGAIPNLIRRNVDISASLVVGGFAAATSFTGAWLAAVIDSSLSAILFAILLVVTAAQLAWRIVRPGRG